MLENKKIGYPCFSCRQVLLEFFDKDTLITCIGENEEETHTLTDLCPYPFDQEDLKWRVVLLVWLEDQMLENQH